METMFDFNNCKMSYIFTIDKNTLKYIFNVCISILSGFKDIEVNN